MILDDVGRALAQMGDPRFRGVLIRGVGLTLALFVAIWLAFRWLMRWLLPDTMTLPLVGEVTWLDDLLSGASVLGFLVLLVVLMIPVASAFTSLFLDDVADAVEARHYPHLVQAPRARFVDGVVDSLGFLGVIVLANVLALVAYVLFAPFAPLIFIAVNGYLLGREYFTLVAMRRLGRAGAKAARSRHAGRIWVAGAIMAAPLMIPVLNLLVPVLGAATFTHLYHRLEGEAGRTSRSTRA